MKTKKKNVTNNRETKKIYNTLFQYANLYLNGSIENNNNFNNDIIGISCNCEKKKNKCSRVALRILIREEFIWTKFLWENIYRLFTENNNEKVINEYIMTINPQEIKEKIKKIIKVCEDVIRKITDMYEFISFQSEEEVIEKIPLQARDKIFAIKLRKFLNLQENAVKDPDYIPTERSHRIKKDQHYAYINLIGYKIINDKRRGGFDNKVYKKLFYHPDIFQKEI